MLSKFESRLHERALASARRYGEAHAELLTVIMEVDAARLYLAFNLTSTFQYCIQKLGLSESVTCAFTSVARKAREVPELKRAVDDGLDFTKAKIAARVITPENQAHLIAVATVGTCKDLERRIVQDHPREAVVERVRIVAEDRHKLELGLSEAVLAKLRRAQDLVCNKAKKAASLEDTLAAVLELYLEKEDPRRKAERARMVTREPDRRTKNIPAASLHAVNKRDQRRCQEPGCAATRWVDIHHVISRADGGGHEPANLITLCGAHHRKLHREKGNEIHPPRGRLGAVTSKRAPGFALANPTGLSARRNRDPVEHSRL